MQVVVLMDVDHEMAHASVFVQPRGMYHGGEAWPTRPPGGHDRRGEEHDPRAVGCCGVRREDQPRKLHKTGRIGWVA
jgi:hypothetical protein